MVNTRTFFLEIDESLIPFTKAPRKGYKSLQMTNGMYFNTKSRLQGSQLIQYSYAAETEKFILEALRTEITNLQKFWYNNIPRYFNRRAYGMYFSRHMLRSTHSFRKSFTKTRQQSPGRQRTGQLRRALIPRSISLQGVELYVKPCRAATGHNVDYVNILIKGANPQWGHPYVPSLDRRVSKNKGVWRGITSRYWAEWQAVFIRQINASNIRLNNKIEKFLLSKNIVEKKDLKKVSGGYASQRNISRIREEVTSRKSRSTVFKQGYDASRNFRYWESGPYKKFI